MTNHRIPAEAVEAAMVALDESWVTDAGREQLRGMVAHILEAAAPHIERAAVADELAELAEIMEPFSGKAGLANDATRGEIAKWLRARLASVRSKKQSRWPTSRSQPILSKRVAVRPPAS